MAEATQSSDAGHSSQATRSSETAHSQSRAAHSGKHVHHGRTPAAWTGVTLGMIGFLLGGFAMVDGPNWTLFWISAAILVIALIAARVLQVLGYGAS